MRPKYVIYRNNKDRVGPKGRLDPMGSGMPLRDDYEELEIIEAKDVIEARKLAQAKYGKSVSVMHLSMLFGRKTLLA